MTQIDGFEKIDFAYQGRPCSVRAARTAEEWRIQAFAGDVPVGSLITVSAETIADARATDPDRNLLLECMQQLREELEGGQITLPGQNGQA